MFNYTYSFLYVLIASFSYIFMEYTVTTWSPVLSLIFSIFLATLYFHITNIHHIKATYTQAIKDKWNWLWVNLTVMVMWGAAFHSVFYIGPFGYLFLFYSTAAVFGFFFQVKNEKTIRFPRIISMIIIIFLIVIYIGFIEKHTNHYYLLGNFLAILSGTMSYAYSKTSFSFSKNTSLSATQILAIRFYALLIFSILLCWIEPFSVNLSLHILWHMALLAALSFILPLYFFQKAVLKVGPEAQSIFIAFSPAVTYLLKILIDHQFDLYPFLVSIILGIMLIIPAIIKMKNQKSVTKNL